MLEILQPLHPRVVHFPIALFVTGLGLEVVSLLFKKESLHRTALHIYVLAALLTPLVVRTGIWEETRLHLSHPILDKHRMFALWTMWVSLASLPVLWFLKKELPKFLRLIFLVFLIGVAATVILTGHNGGRMVYEYGVGTQE